MSTIAAVGSILLVQLVPASPAQSPAAKKVNPVTGNAEAIKEGRALYLKHNCSGCHGVGGGGGMAMPLIDETWKFGSSDEVLFKLIKGEIAESTMPKTWSSLEPDEVWKIIAYVRSLRPGNPSKVDG
jgi:mono/diheme cytochrome c family protein